MAWQTRVEMQRQTLVDCHEDRRRYDRDRRARHKAEMESLENECSTLRSKLHSADEMIQTLLKQTEQDSLTLRTVRDTCRLIGDELDKSKKLVEFHQSECLREQSKTSELTKLIDVLIKERDDWILEKEQYQKRMVHQDDEKVISLQKQLVITNTTLEHIKTERDQIKAENELLKSNNMKMMELLAHTTEYRHVLSPPSETSPVPTSSTPRHHRDSGSSNSSSLSSLGHKSPACHNRPGPCAKSHCTLASNHNGRHMDPSHHSHCIHRCCETQPVGQLPQNKAHRSHGDHHDRPDSCRSRESECRHKVSHKMAAKSHPR